MFRLPFLVATLILAGSVAQAQQLDHTLHRLPSPSGFVVTPGMTGLVVALPDSSELVYYNTLTEQEVKRVSLDFVPGAMCLQGRTLYVAGQGAALVYALQLTDGKLVKEYEIPGDAVAGLACAAEGPIFASTASRQIHVIDPAKGTATKSTALGVYLGVTPDAKSLITGFQPSDMEYSYNASPLLSGVVKIPWDGTWGCRAQLLKYKIEGTDLKFEAAQNNAASNGWAFHLSPDGTRAMMPGGGGWRPPDGVQGGGYVTAVFSTTTLQTMVGQAPHATNIAFHPTLNLAVSTRDNKELEVLNAKSFKPREKIIVASAAGGGSQLLTFGGKGTTVILWNGDNPQNPLEGLHFLPLELSDEERATLEKAHGKLPAPVAVESVAAAEPATPAPAPMPVPPGRGIRPRPVPPPGAPPSPPGKATAPVEATAGFNDAKGINADAKRQSPYVLGVAGVGGGVGEAGWLEPWALKGDATKVVFATEPVHEGDGALHLADTSIAMRSLAAPINDFVEIEMHLQVPADGHLAVYVHQAEGATGPMWEVKDRKFLVLNGTGGHELESHPWVDTGIACEPDRWYQVAAKIDVKRKEFELWIDGEKLDHAPFHFRTNVAQIAGLKFMSENPSGGYVDAVRIKPLKESPLEKAEESPAPMPQAPSVVDAPPARSTNAKAKAKGKAKGSGRPAGPVEATAGFNDAKGINADSKRQSPYPLGIPGVAGGLGEAGWAAPWVVGFDDPSKLSFVRDVVQEGDGAVYLVRTAHMKRPLAVPIKDFVEVEMHVRVPEGGGCLIYIAEGEGATGPMWGAGKGKLHAIQGSGQEYGQTQAIDVVTELDPEKWYKVTVKADVKRHEFDFYVDDKKFEHAPFHFRHDVSAIGLIGLLVEETGGAYFDQIRVTPLKESPLEAE